MVARLLLFDAEVCEGIAEYLVGSDLSACDFGEMEGNFEDVFACKVD